MNNFAVSSDGLATALQDSASALMEGGNNLEQSVALIAAANKVVQDPSQVGNALRTISLRLRGTSLEVMQELGEETDGIVEGVSKMQEKIKAASGVDILTETGDYKDTYTILKEIGQVWEDMSDVDQAALLELMAGKNRSNVLAALLGNMDDLSGAYESAMNAEGSAMQENEAYLDSIQGKIDQFNNSLQTMWMNALNSDLVKFFIDLGKVIVEAADSLGLLNTAMAGIFAFSALKSNSFGDFISFKDGQFGLGKNGQSVKNFGASIVEGLSNFSFDNIKNFSFKDFGTKLKNKFIEEIKDDVEDMADVLGSSFSDVTDNINFDHFTSGAEVMDDLSDATKQQASASKAAGAANAANAQKIKLVGVAAKVASVGVKLLNAALTFGIGLLVSFAIEKAIGWIDDLIHKQDNLRESAKEVLDTYSNAKANANKSKELVDSVGSEYETLAKGVDAFGNNISLTSAQYERYHEICNQIADQFPTMVSGYDAEGNAILKNKGNVEALTAAYEEQAQAARQAAIAGADDVFDAFKGEYDNSAQWFWEKDTGLKQQYELAQRLVDLIGSENIGGLNTFFNPSAGASYSNKDLKNMLESVGIEKGDVWDASTGVDLEALQKIMPKLQSYLKTSVSKINAETSKITTLMEAYLGEDFDYAKLDNKTQSVVDAIVSGLDAGLINRFDSADEMYAWIDANILSPFTDTDKSSVITEAMQNLLEPDMDGINWSKYKENIAKYKEQLWEAFGGENNTLGENGAAMSEEDFFKMLGIEIPDTKVYEDKIKKALQDFKGMTEEQANNYLNNLDPITVQRLFEVEWEDVSEENIDDVLNPVIEKGPTEIKTYSVLAADLETYNEALSNTAELTVEGMQASDDYVTSLSSIGLTAEQVGKCIDTENGNIVTNVDLLNQYVQNAKKGVLENTRLAKSQSQLKYYELYKQMHELTNGTNQLTDAQREQVNAIYDQMNALEQTITKYSMLEQEILGATNAYTQFEQAQAADSATDYISNTENMLSALLDGFETGMVGTETFKAAIAGMVPESVYKDLDTVEAKMQAIYNYAKQDLGRYFTIDSDGNVDSTWDNMTNLIKDGRALGVFTGKDNNHIELSKDIASLKQFAEAFNITEEAAYALLVNMEKMDGEWINGDNQSFLDQLDPNKLSTSIYETTSAMADLEHAMANGEVSVDEYNAKYQELSKTQSDNAKKAQESAAAWIDANNNYQTAYDKVKSLNDEIAQMKEDGASEAEIQVKTDELAAATTELQQAVDVKSQLTEPSEVVIQLALDSINGQIEQWKADNAELELKVTPKLIQDENGEWTIPAEVKANLSEEEKKKVEDYLTLLNQKKQIEGSTTTEQDSTNDQLKETKSLLEEVTDTLDGMPDLNIDTKDSLESLKELASILKKISDGDYDVEAEIDAAINKSEKRKKEAKKKQSEKKKTTTGSATTTSSGGNGGFVSPAIVTSTSNSSSNEKSTSTKKQKIEEPEPPEIDWDGAFDKVNDWGSKVVKEAKEFFGETVPEKAGEVWDEAGKKFQQVNDWGSRIVDDGKEFFGEIVPEAIGGALESAPEAMGAAVENIEWFFTETLPSVFEGINDWGADLKGKVVEFFTTTIPQAWNDFWTSAGNVFEGINNFGAELKNKVIEFFTVTIPSKWNEFWTDAGNVFESINNWGTELKNKVVEFFTITIPTKWNSFWDSAANIFEGINNFGANLSNKVQEFFTITIPEKWNEFWDGAGDIFEGINNWGSNLADKVSSFFSETIPNLWEKFKAGFWGGYDESRTKHESEKANDTLKETGATNYTFNIESNNIDDITSQIQEAQKALEHFTSSDGTINIEAEGCEEAQVMLATLISKKQALETPAILQVDTSTSEADVQNVINLINEFKTNYNTLEIQTAIGGDTTQAQAELNTTIASLQQASPEILAKLGVDPTAAAADINAAINGITPTLMVQAGVDPTKVQEFQNEEHNTTGECTWENNAKKVKDWMAKTLVKTGTVKWKNDTTKVKTTFTATGSVSWNNTEGPHGVNGSAHSIGTVHANGDWGIPRAEKKALVGELGQELIVDPNTGRYYTVGDYGAEFVNLPKNAIIFNHIQTRALLENGYVTGRGKAFVTGNAHLTRIPPGSGGGSGGKSGSSSSSSKSSSKSNSTAKKNTEATKDAAEQVVDFIEFKLTEIEQIISKSTAKIETLVGDGTKRKEKDDLYDKLVQAESNKAETYLAAAEKYNERANAALEKVPEQYREWAKNGAIEIVDFIGETDQEYAEAIQEYRDWADKADDAEVGYLEAIAQATAYRIEQLDDIAEEYANLIDVISAKSDVLNSAKDLMEEMGMRASETWYKQLISNEEAIIKKKQEELETLVNQLAEDVAKGDIKVGDPAYLKKVAEFEQLRAEIYDSKTAVEEFNNEIQNIKWDNLDRLIDRFDNLDSELSFLYENFTRLDDVVDDGGAWTDKGIAAIGVAAQQMEVAQTKIQQYNKALKDLYKSRDQYSPDEFIAKEAELKENIFDAVNAYNDAQDAIIDLNKTRVDAVKDGIEKEIDAYKELIDKKKEALDADKDLYDFEKSINEQQKDITKLQNQIAALTGNNSMEAVAKRRKLEAELAEAQAELEDTFRDRSYEKAKELLEQSAEDYENSQNDKIDALDESLKDTETLVADSLETVKSKADTVLAEIDALGQQYGITISDSIVKPWKDGENAISSYQKKLQGLKDSFAEQLQAIIDAEKEIQEISDKKAQADLSFIEQTDINKQVIDQSNALIEQNKKPSQGQSNTNTNQNTKDAPVKGDKVVIDSDAQYYGGNSSNVKIPNWVKGNQYTVQQVGYGGKQVLLKEIYSWVKISDLKGYSKGTISAKEKQLAWVDELGEELQLVPGKNGRLEYIKKGTGIIPADLTEKLMNLALDPTQVLENNRPKINISHITNNEIHIDAGIAEVVHIDTVTNDTLPDLAKTVEKQMDKYVKSLNSQIRKYVR